MPEIFQNTDVPVWLQRITQPPDAGAIGKDIGGVLAGVVNSFGRDENAAPDNEDYWGTRKGFEKGMQESRMNQADPMWRLKKTEIEAKVKDALAQAESRHALAQQHSSETSAWMKAIPVLAPWKAATPEERATMPTPDVGPSRTAWKVVQDQQNADWRYARQKEMNDLQKMRAENTTTQAKLAVADAKKFTDLLATLEDPIERQAIREMQTDPQQVGPSTEQWARLNAAKGREVEAAKTKAASAPGTLQKTTIGPDGKVRTTFQTQKPPPIVALQQALVAAINAGDEDSASEIQAQIEKMNVTALDVEGKRQEGRLEVEKTRAANRGAGSPLGKLIEDRNKAAASGAMDDVHLFQNAIDATKKGEPIMRTYKGQTVLYMPGSSTLHFLKDPETEAESKLLNKEFEANLRDISEARKNASTRKNVPELERKAAQTRSKITSLFERAEVMATPPAGETGASAPAAPAGTTNAPGKVRKYNPATDEFE